MFHLPMMAENAWWLPGSAVSARLSLARCALGAIIARRRLGQVLTHRLSNIGRWSRRLQATARLMIVVIADHALWTAV